MMRYLAAGSLNGEEVMLFSGLALPEVLMRLIELELERRVASLQSS